MLGDSWGHHLFWRGVALRAGLAISGAGGWAKTTCGQLLATPETLQGSFLGSQGPTVLLRFGNVCFKPPCAWSMTCLRMLAMPRLGVKKPSLTCLKEAFNEVDFPIFWLCCGDAIGNWQLQRLLWFIWQPTRIVDFEVNPRIQGPQTEMELWQVFRYAWQLSAYGRSSGWM